MLGHNNNFDRIHEMLTYLRRDMFKEDLVKSFHVVSYYREQNSVET